MTAGAAASPLTDAEFAALMAACGPFEPAPHIAVALSGGPDSLALTLLLKGWSQTQGGRLTALTVDHGLRAESGDEAAQVADRMRAHGIAHEILTWRGDKPASGLMAAAREARYGLLEDWCRHHDCLHLALGHQLEDQAATFLMRLARGSGLAGLAAMPAVSPDFPRRVRPLLQIPRARLKATLRARGQDWIEDPSNDNPAFERTAATDFISGPNALGLTADRVALAAESLARASAAINEAVAHALSDCVTLSALGVAHIDAVQLGKAAEEVRLRALARVLVTVGGSTYTPRLERLTRLMAAIEANELGQGRTLAGCRIVPSNNGVTILREAAAIEPARPVRQTDFLWDRRFRLTVPESLISSRTMIARLDTPLWRALKDMHPVCARSSIPARVRATLPLLYDDGGPLAAPHFGFAREGIHSPVSAHFAPARPLT